MRRSRLSRIRAVPHQSFSVGFPAQGFVRRHNSEFRPIYSPLYIAIHCRMPERVGELSTQMQAVLKERIGLLPTPFQPIAEDLTLPESSRSLQKRLLCIMERGQDVPNGSGAIQGGLRTERNTILKIVLARYSMEPSIRLIRSRDFEILSKMTRSIFPTP